MYVDMANVYLKPLNQAVGRGGGGLRQGNHQTTSFPSPQLQTPSHRLTPPLLPPTVDAPSLHHYNLPQEREL